MKTQCNEITHLLTFDIQNQLGFHLAVDPAIRTDVPILFVFVPLERQPELGARGDEVPNDGQAAVLCQLQQKGNSSYSACPYFWCLLLFDQIGGENRV